MADMGDSGDSGRALARLRQLAVKDRVSMGGLSEADRRLALAAIARTLAPGEVLGERDVSERLREALADSFVELDAAELRRWLVDTGWWQRDGYGRAYARTAVAALPPALAELDVRLGAFDLLAVMAQHRATQRAQREARRQAWAARGPVDSTQPSGHAG